MWDIHRNLDHEVIPAGRTTLRFTFCDVTTPPRNWGVVVTGDVVDLCDFDPGHPLQVTVDTDLRSLTLVWRSDLSWRDALRSGAIEEHGPAYARRALPRWLKLPAFATVPRPASTACA